MCVGRVCMKSEEIIIFGKEIFDFLLLLTVMSVVLSLCSSVVLTSLIM